jgi:poly(ADP-ribose) glycohydrolase ARH3
MLGCVVGDALGRPFETMGASDARLGGLLRAMLVSDAPWRYTDDSEMMIAVAESLVRRGGVATDDLLPALAASYDPTRGYDQGMKLALEAHRAGRRSGAFASWHEGSRGNGGAVRVVAIACAYHDDPKTLTALAEESAGVTHAHPLGRAGAVAHALAIARVLARQNTARRIAVPTLLKRLSRPLVVTTGLASKLEAVARLVDASATAAEAARILGNGTLAEQAVPLALFCFLRWAPDFKAVVTNAVLAGGDTDTIAAMSGALCGALAGEAAIPPRWLERLEGEAKDPTYLRALADRAFELWSGEASKRETI